MALNKVNYISGQTVISAQNMNDIQDEVIRLGEKEAVQSDWLETDESSLGYVKNKPFGVAGQYTVLCTAEEAAASNELIEIISDTSYNDVYNEGSNIYYLYRVSQLYQFFDFYGFGLNHRIAFETSSGFYATLYDLKMGGGNRRSISSYISNPNITGFIQFWGDIDSALFNGVIVIEESTDDTIKTGVYIGFSAKKETSINRVLRNNSYIFLGPGALSTIDMPLGVLYALMMLEGVNTPLAPVIASADEAITNLSNALNNKVDKVGSKVLSDVNFTKAYETQVKNISSLENRISNLEYYHDDDSYYFEAMKSSASLMTSSIATNPRGSVINTQILMEEYEKLMTGQSSDKLFILDADEGIMAMKISDKLPSKEDFKKGFAVTMGGLDYMLGMDTMQPLAGAFIPSVTLSPSFWENEGDFFVDITAKSFTVMDCIVVVGDEIVDVDLPLGLYAFGTMNQFIIGLQINGFDLSASSAPVSQEQLGDISSILDSIIGEQVWTFTLEDGSTVDKVVISSD